MKITKIVCALMLLTSLLVTPSYAERSHKRPTMGGIFSGWYQQLRRAGGAKFHRELVDAGDNLGIATMNRVEKAGNVIATGLSKSYTAACVVSETGAHLATSVVKGTVNAGFVLGKATFNAYDAGMDSLSESSKTCVNPAWIEMKTTIKHIFVHGHNIKTISRDTLNQNFPGLATKVTKILRSDEDTDICAVWKKVPATVRQVLLESGGSHPLYDTMTALADDFEDAFSTSTSIKKHIQEDCSTDFTMTC